MIKQQTGEIYLPSGEVRVGPGLTKDRFEASSLMAESRESVSDMPWVTFELPIVDYQEKQFGWSLTFQDTILRNVSIQCVNAQFGCSWSEWSEQRERLRKELHDELLMGCLGADFTQFAWGSVQSIFDPKAGSSFILVTYVR